METTHRVVEGDARELVAVPDESIDLVVTSPPYPMIEMWDETFARLNPEVEDALAAGEGWRAFELMHEELNAVWEHLPRVVADGGVVCVNVGDATRKVDGEFRVYPNHVRVVETLQSLGFEPLPDVLWRKPANSAAKFMGSGMLPTNAYVTLEHEHVLVFRKGGTREFEPGADQRYEAAYFWEERNRWFSDVWTDVNGELQDLAHDDLRERSGAFPFEVPYRLINMYSVYGDTVLDPFWGTGTTSLAAMVAGRDSVGFELEPAFVEVFDERVADVPALSRAVIDRRLERHREFVAECRSEGDSLAYEATRYDFPVRTKQERDIRLYAVDGVERTAEGYRATHVPVETAPEPSARPDD